MATRPKSPINPHLGTVVLSRHAVRRCAERAELFAEDEPRAYGLARARAMLKRIVERARPAALVHQPGGRNDQLRFGSEPDQYLALDRFVVAVKRHPERPRLWKATTCYFVESVTLL